MKPEGTRFLAFGDTHGHFLDERAFERLRQFKKWWKPDVVIAGGDIFDFPAFRHKASEEDLAYDIEADMEMGLRVLRTMQPKVYLLGNHEYRIYELRRSPKAADRELAGRMIEDIETACRAMRCKIFPYDHTAGVFKLGPVRFLHGFYTGEFALKRHAPIYSPCVIFHIHAAGMHVTPVWGEPCGHRAAYSCPSMAKGLPYEFRLPSAMRHECGWVYGWASQHAYRVDFCRESEGFAYGW